MKTPITWYGGKQRLQKYILPLIPDHITYTEPFFGGGAIFFSKDPSKCEVINDINKEAINFYSTVVKHFDELNLEIQSTLHSRSLFDDAKLVNQNPHLFSDVKRAWSFYVLANQSFASDMSTFGYRISPKWTNMSETMNKKKVDFTDEYKKRLERTTIECEDAISVISRYDTPNTFHYIDPPYFNSECKFYEGYTIEEFRTLLSTLSSIEGKFLLSSYPSEILTEFTKANNWYTKEIIKEVSVNNGKNKKKTEVLTANYPI